MGPENQNIELKETKKPHRAELVIVLRGLWETHITLHVVIFSTISIRNMNWCFKEWEHWQYDGRLPALVLLVNVSANNNKAYWNQLGDKTRLLFPDRCYEWLGAQVQLQHIAYITVSSQHLFQDMEVVIIRRDYTRSADVGSRLHLTSDLTTWHRFLWLEELLPFCF